MLGALRIQVENAYGRITLTPVHFCFFLVAFIHAASLVFLQSVSFVVNAEARDLMIHIMQVTGAQRDSVAITAKNPLSLYLCQEVPGNGLSCGFSAKDYEDMMHACVQISPPVNVTAVGMDDDALVAKRLLFDGSMTLIPDIRNSTLFGLSIVGIGTPEGIRDPDGNLWVSDACAASLRYPEQQFQDAERENVSFLFFHIWLFTISVIAITHESIPHIASALAGQVLSTSWSTWDIFRTLQFKMRFEALVADALCGGANLLPNYWRLRNQFNVSIACINWGALAVASYLSFRLIKMYLTANFRSVGSAPTIEKLYRVLMIFSTVLRLYLFFVMLTTALWIDQIDGGLMHTFLTKAQYNGYLGICSIALIMALPLALLGDISMRTERRKLAAVYLVMQGFFLVFHASLLASSPIYRWTLILWPFFALNVACSFILAAAALAMGIVSRVNFGHGLDHYLHVASVLEKTGFTRAFMPSEPEPSRRKVPPGKFDALLEQGETVKVATVFRSKTKPKPARRDSTESFGQTTHDSMSLNEKFTGVETGATMPVFDNRAAVRVLDGAAGRREVGDT